MQLVTEKLRVEIAAAIKPMEGWCTEEKAVAMAELILETSPVLVVELGVFGGRSLIPQAIALRASGQGIIIGIDPWKRSAALEGDNGTENDRWWANLDYHAIHRSCMENIWKNDLDEQCIVFRASSEQCTTFTGSYGIDNINILHIDGNHSELTSCRDVTTWVPRVASNGYIWFDDADWPSTKKAQDLMLHYAVKIKELEGGKCFLYRKK